MPIWADRSLMGKGGAVFTTRWDVSDNSAVEEEENKYFVRYVKKTSRYTLRNERDGHDRHNAALSIMHEEIEAPPLLGFQSRFEGRVDQIMWEFVGYELRILCVTAEIFA